jgi:lauroyl/myristoyl acyltransferase
MKLTLMRLAHQTPGLRQLAKRIHPKWFFRLTLWGVTLSSLCWPHTKKLARPFREILRGTFDDYELRKRARRYLLYLRLFKDLESAWSNWEKRHEEWVTIDGENYLRNALVEGNGAILISSHNYGFSKLVAPVLALRGYKVHRGGGGKKDGRRVARWGKNYPMSWNYLDYKGDYWHRLQLLKSTRGVLADNGVVHVSPRAYRQGPEEMAVEIFERKYFLDATWFRLFRMCEAPVLPCFAVGNTAGQIKIVLHPALPSATTDMVKKFAEIQDSYLKEFPEFGRLWKDIYLEREKT